MIARAHLIDVRACFQQRVDGVDVPFPHGEQQRRQTALVADELTEGQASAVCATPAAAVTAYSAAARWSATAIACAGPTAPTGKRQHGRRRRAGLRGTNRRDATHVCLRSRALHAVELRHVLDLRRCRDITAAVCQELDD